MSKEDNQNDELKRVKEIISKLKGFGKVASSNRKKSTPSIKQNNERYSEEIESSEYRDDFPVNEEKEVK